MIASVGRVVLQIADLERSLGFYRDIIGFRELDRLDVNARRSAHLGVTGSDRVWLELRERPGARPFPRSRLLGLYHFAVLLPSRAHLGRLFVHAVNAGTEVASANHLVSEALYLVDPDGLTIEIYRDLPRSEWRYTGDELSLATLPLDIDAIVAEAGDTEPWAGLPAGTVNGHVHFFVGDLPSAEDFYVRGLGFEPTLRSFPGALFVSSGGYHHHVGLNTWARTARPATDADARLLWWEMVVPTPHDVPAVAERLRGGGYQTENTDGAIEATDTWGIKVRVLST